MMIVRGGRQAAFVYEIRDVDRGSVKPVSKLLTLETLDKVVTELSTTSAPPLTNGGGSGSVDTPGGPEAQDGT